MHGSSLSEGQMLHRVKVRGLAIINLYVLQIHMGREGVRIWLMITVKQTET